jgi:replication factor C small subunit
MSSVVTQLFTEKFRPKELTTLIIPDRIRSELSRGLIQNILLFGNAGNGKTSAGFILSKPYTTLYINASSERGIDIIREKIGKFCSTISLEGGKENLKCVFLDEIDGATEEFFKALRAVMEKYANVVRFIATANYIQKISEPIQSRFNCISFDAINSDEEQYLIEEYKKRIELILNAAKITYNLEILDKFVRNDFPDMRHILNSIQSLYLQGVKELNLSNIYTNFDFKNLFEMVFQNLKPWENYKLIISDYSNKVKESIAAFSDFFPEYLKTYHPEKIDKLPLILIANAEYQYQVNFVIDEIISLLALVFKIQIILND